MYCMKCGREMESEQAFCEDCLVEMEKYPVDPGTVIQLPIRKETAVVRKPQKRRGPTPEEQIYQLTKRVYLLTGALAVTLLLILFMAQPTMNYLLKNYRVQPGQNYNTVVTTEATEDPYEGLAE